MGELVHLVQIVADPKKVSEINNRSSRKWKLNWQSFYNHHMPVSEHTENMVLPSAQFVFMQWIELIEQRGIQKRKALLCQVLLLIANHYIKNRNVSGTHLQWNMKPNYSEKVVSFWPSLTFYNACSVSGCRAGRGGLCADQCVGWWRGEHQSQNRLVSSSYCNYSRTVVFVLVSLCLVLSL